MTRIRDQVLYFVGKQGKRMKQLMLGNAAVARGLYEAGCGVVSSSSTTVSRSTEAAKSRISFSGRGHAIPSFKTGKRSPQTSFTY